MHVSELKLDIAQLALVFQCLDRAGYIRGVLLLKNGCLAELRCLQGETICDFHLVPNDDAGRVRAIAFLFLLKSTGREVEDLLS